MVARQFGFVVSRGLAVWAFCIALNHIYAYMNLREMSMGFNPRSTFFLVGPVVMPVIYLLIATFLWTGANQFAGPMAESEARVQSGAWVPRLVLSCLGGFVALNALGEIAVQSLKINAIWQLQQSSAEKNTAFAVESVKFLLGLGLFLFNRFDRVALHEAAQCGAVVEEANPQSTD